MTALRSRDRTAVTVVCSTPEQRTWAETSTAALDTKAALHKHSTHLPCNSVGETPHRGLPLRHACPSADASRAAARSTAAAFAAVARCSLLFAVRSEASNAAHVRGASCPSTSIPTGFANSCARARHTTTGAAAAAAPHTPDPPFAKRPDGTTRCNTTTRSR